jgi:hypothetical protein
VRSIRRLARGGVERWSPAGGGPFIRKVEIAAPRPMSPIDAPISGSAMPALAVMVSNQPKLPI